MSHRALGIVQAAKTALITNGAWRSDVHVQRRFSLKDDAELPAAIVAPGDDAPVGALGASNVAYVDSLLVISIVTLVMADTEELVLEQLFEHRRQVHMALMADRTLGLEYVIDTRYAGAPAPEISATARRLVGSLESRWAVHYRMNLTDPE